MEVKTQAKNAVNVHEKKNSTSTSMEILENKRQTMCVDGRSRRPSTLFIAQSVRALRARPSSAFFMRPQSASADVERLPGYARRENKVGPGWAESTAQDTSVADHRSTCSQKHHHQCAR